MKQCHVEKVVYRWSITILQTEDHAHVINQLITLGVVFSFTVSLDQL